MNTDTECDSAQYLLDILNFYRKNTNPGGEISKEAKYYPYHADSLKIIEYYRRIFCHSSVCLSGNRSVIPCQRVIPILESTKKE